MFTGNGTKLVGDDALVQKVDIYGTVCEGDGVTPLDAGLYIVLAVANPSGFPPNTTGDAIAVGDFLLVDAGTVITPLATEVVVSVTVEDLCDISDFKMDFTKPEIKVTTQCDVIDVYRQGKPDMSGAMNGIFTVGVSDAVEGFLNEFIDIRRQDGATSFDTYEKRDSILLGLFYVNSKIEIADRMLVIAPFVLFGYSVGGEMGSPQSFSSTFRFSNLSYDDGTYAVELKPSFYRWGTEEAT